MLGFHPIASAPVASQFDVLVTVASPITASGGMSFSGTFVWGQIATIEALGGLTFGGTADISSGVSISATGGISFGGSPVWTSLNALGSSGGIVFGGHPRLRVAGKPIIITAVPSSYKVRADLAAYDIAAVPQSFTLRGVQ